MSRFTYDNVIEVYCDYCGNDYVCWESDYDNEYIHYCPDCSYMPLPEEEEYE